MKSAPIPLAPSVRPLCGALLLAVASLAAPVWAAKADNQQPLNISADKGGRVDIVTQRTHFAGNVMLTRGSLLLQAESMDVRETAEGYFQAHAQGMPSKPVSFRQARERGGEFIEGQADQLEYDTRTDTVRFIGNAVVRRKAGAVVADEVTGALIVYDNRREVFSVEGGSASPQPNGRVRLVLMPRHSEPVSPEAKPSGLPLKSSPDLQPRKPS